MWEGTVIENSLEDKSILNELQVVKTWQAGDWILHNVLVEENKILGICKYLAEGSWYIHFWKSGEDKVIVVFKHKAFEILYSDKSTWVDAIQYGKSIGVPGEQLDFVIP